MHEFFRVSHVFHEFFSECIDITLWGKNAIFSIANAISETFHIICKRRKSIRISLKNNESIPLLHTRDEQCLRSSQIRRKIRTISEKMDIFLKSERLYEFLKLRHICHILRISDDIHAIFRELCMKNGKYPNRMIHPFDAC